jgi:hypothetical protein
MGEQSSTSKTTDAFCLGCGYSLRELTDPRCPECGRGFDPDDARTMSLGRPLWQWQRWLLRPLGWRTISLALLGTAGLVYLSRWPGLSPEPWSVLRGEFRWYWPVVRPLTLPGVVFAASAILWACSWPWRFSGRLRGSSSPAPPAGQRCAPSIPVGDAAR